MPNRRAHKPKRTSNKSSADRIIANATFTKTLTTAAGVSSVTTLDPLSLPAPIVTEAQIRKFYRIIGVDIEMQPIGLGSNQFDYVVAFVPSQLESTPTSQTVTTLMGFLHNLYNSSGCTVPKRLRLTDRQLQALCQFPQGKYACEPSAAANASEEVQASLAFAHTSASSVTIFLKIRIAIEFWDFVGSVINPAEDRLAKTAAKVKLLEAKMLTYEKARDTCVDDKGNLVPYPIFDLATRTPEQKASQYAWMDAMVRSGYAKKTESGDYVFSYNP